MFNPLFVLFDCTLLVSFLFCYWIIFEHWHGKDALDILFIACTYLPLPYKFLSF